MSFWESFREGYRARRADVPPPFVEPAETAPEPVPDPVEELEERLRTREEELAESRQLIADLAAEMRRLEEELKIARRSQSPRSGGGDEKYRKLRRAVVKHVHPDHASGDPRLAKALEAICKDLNAEIDRIDRS